MSKETSFSEAFAAARAEQGPGGVFEWHGKIYGTYYRNEWDKMSSAEKAAFTRDAVRNHGGRADSDDHVPTVEVDADEDMSFSEAFAAARAEQGPGGVFEWHGKIYGTYYRNEWDKMSSAEKAAFTRDAVRNHGGRADGDDHVPTVEVDADEDVSFSEAFAAARAEQGPGGVFEWHGKTYNTYYRDEWNKMTAEERAEFGDSVQKGTPYDTREYAECDVEDDHCCPPLWSNVEYDGEDQLCTFPEEECLGCEFEEPSDDFVYGI